MTRRGFTLVELLVVVAIIALLIAILLPALNHARQQAKTTNCLTNMRNLEVAHQMYMAENNAHFVDVGLSHGSGVGLDEEVAWIRTLESAYGHALIRKSPVDDSPHWDPKLGGQGVEVPDLPDDEYPYRRTSYGINNLLTVSAAPFDPQRGRRFDYAREEAVPRASETVHFVYMAEEGDFAAADHTHVENWELNGLWQLVPRRAGTELELHAHGGPVQSYESITNYGFLDGHAETLPFKQVWRRIDDNNFWPDVAR